LGSVWGHGNCRSGDALTLFRFPGAAYIVSGERFHRIAAMPQGHRQAEIGSAVVPNPFHNPGHPEDSSNPRHVAARIRPDAVQSLYSRGKLDDHQFATARQLGRLFEILELGGVRSLDPGKVVVDGGRLNGGIGDRELKAGRELAAARELLGMRQYGLVRAVCLDGCALSEVQGYAADKRVRLFLADLLRLALDDMADRWGLGR
jgi:hypothetical protein